MDIHLWNLVSQNLCTKQQQKTRIKLQIGNFIKALWNNTEFATKMRTGEI